MDEYYIYIDEAGDEGFGKLRNPDSGGQSRWLMLGAAVVSKENDRKMPKWRDEILTQFPKRQARDLHFQKLNHDQKVVACRYISDKPVGAIVVCSDKSTITDLNPRLLTVCKQKGHLYNYLVRLLLERVSEACVLKSGSNPCKIFVTFSKRGGTNYEAMRDYLFLMRDGKEKLRPIRAIKWSALNPEDIRVENHAARAGLQIADLVTSATYKAFEPNLYGDTEPRYTELLRARFVRSRSEILGCGITIVPKTSDAFRMHQGLFNRLV